MHDQPRMIIRKSPAELEKMRAAGLLVHSILQTLKGMVRDGISTMELELAAEKMVSDAGAKPAFKGYYVPAVGQTYKYVLCTSVNDEIVHGIPGARTIKEGDIVSIDLGLTL